VTLVKICGITNLNDALLSARLGADMLGFNFYAKSPRFIEPDAAADVGAQLPSNVIKVGVFVNAELEHIISAAQIAGLDAVQLHGSESSTFVKSVKDAAGLEVIKAFRVSSDFLPDKVARCGADAVLLDAYSRDAFGGTGHAFDWTIARSVAGIIPKLFLAGGLSEVNIADAIDQVRPYCVDACSRLESSAGIKDEVKLRNFMKNAGKNI